MSEKESPTPAPITSRLKKPRLGPVFFFFAGATVMFIIMNLMHIVTFGHFAIYLLSLYFTWRMGIRWGDYERELKSYEMSLRIIQLIEEKVAEAREKRLSREKRDEEESSHTSES